MRGFDGHRCHDSAITADGHVDQGKGDIVLCSAWLRTVPLPSPVDPRNQRQDQWPQGKRLEDAVAYCARLQAACSCQVR